MVRNRVWLLGLFVFRFVGWVLGVVVGFVGFGFGFLHRVLPGMLSR